MENILEVIKKHKNKINELSTRLINVTDFNEEILINIEIKNETEFLLSLFNIKKNLININQFPNQFMFSPQQQQQMAQQQAIMQQQAMMHQQMMQQHMMAAQALANKQAQMNNILNNMGNDKNEINIKFNKKGNIIYIKMSNDEMVAELIDKYMKKTNTNKGTFKFCNNILLPTDISTLYEVGLKDNSEIIVS